MGAACQPCMQHSALLAKGRTTLTDTLPCPAWIMNGAGVT